MNDPIVESLLTDCRSQDPARQAPAIAKLHDLEAYEAVPTLLDLLTSSEWNIRALAVKALGWLGDESAETVGPALMKLLNDPEDIVKCDALDALAALDYKLAIEPAKAMLCNDPEWLVQVSAIEALTELADVGASEVLAKFEYALDDPIKPVRSYAARGIGLLGTPELLPNLQKYYVIEESLDTKAEILAARYRLGCQDDLDRLLRLLDSTDDHLVQVILNILEELVTRDVPPSIIASVPRMTDILVKIAQSFPIQHNQAETIISLIQDMKT
jgi:HEAT repeat protein